MNNAIPRIANIYPRLKYIIMEICFFPLRDELEIKEMAEILAAKGQGCIVHMMPRIRHPIAVK